MAVRKAAENEQAREDAGEVGYRAINAGDMEVSDDVSAAKAVVNAFPYAEYEYTTSKIGGETKTFRRLVLTGEWEITADRPAGN